ncbi:hypothetical protein M422DRAFT_247444 [Sphaerobolus stellatus SS14]|nr:hypothetical protein M422DRAFT_247444 [Sphaerobolus stellatus SS14]
MLHRLDITSLDLACHSYLSSESRHYSGLRSRHEVSTLTTEDPILIFLCVFRSTTEMKSIGDTNYDNVPPSTLAIQSELKFPTLDTTTPRISHPSSNNPTIATTPAFYSHRHYRWRTTSVPPHQSPFPMTLYPFTNENLRSSSRRNSPIYLVCRDRYRYATPAFNTSITQSSMHNREIQTEEARKYRFRNAGENDRRAERTNIQTSHIISQFVPFLTFRNPNPPVLTPIIPPDSRQGGSDYILLFNWKYNCDLLNMLGKQSAHTLATTTPSLSHPLCSNNPNIAPIPAFHSHDIVDLASRVTVINVITFHSNRKPTVTFETQ